MNVSGLQICCFASRVVLHPKDQLQLSRINHPITHPFFFFRFPLADESKGLLDILSALLIKLDHAACRQCLTSWETLALTLQQFCTAHGRSNLSVLWDERADWWPLFHFRSDLVPIKDHVSELEWKLTRHKAEAARWLLGKGAVWYFLACLR